MDLTTHNLDQFIKWKDPDALPARGGFDGAGKALKVALATVKWDRSQYINRSYATLNDEGLGCEECPDVNVARCILSADNKVQAIACKASTSGGGPYYLTTTTSEGGSCTNDCSTLGPTFQPNGDLQANALAFWDICYWDSWTDIFALSSYIS